MTDFEIGSNDQGIVFHMTPATGSGGAQIDDTTTAGDKTWSSLKIASELDGKVDKEQGKGLSSNDYTAEEKQKLAGVEAEANKTVVDDALSGTSTNPVQNRVVKNALDQKANSTTVSQLSETIGNLSTTVSGKYAKPSGGIPSTDMSEAVQTSLGKADTALQESDIHSTLTKILDVTLSEEAALIVTEIDGTPLSVEELHFEVLVPSGDLPAQGAKVYCGSTQVGYTYHAAIQNISNRYWFSSWRKDGGVWTSECNDPMTTNNFIPLRRYMISTLYDYSFSFVSCITYPNITKLELPTFPAGTRIRLYAR